MKKKSVISTVLCVAALMAGCIKDDPVEPPAFGVKILDGAIIINKNPNVKIIKKNVLLAGKEVKAGYIPPIDGDLVANHYSFKEVAEMGTLTLKDGNGVTRTAQASHVKFTDGYAFVAYNHKGDTNVGGLVIYKYAVTSGAMENVAVDVKVHTSIELPNAQINAIDFDGKRLYLAGASEETKFGYRDDKNLAFFMVMELFENLNFKPQEPLFIRHLTSYQATSIRARSDKIYITTGDGTDGNGGLHIYDAASFEKITEILGIRNARSVDVDESGIYLMQANHAQITFFNHDADGAGFEIYNREGEAMQRDAKSDMLIWGDYLFVSKNESGMDMLFKNGISNERLDAPNKDSANWFAEEDVTNSVGINSDYKKTADGMSQVQSDLLLLANGRQGLFWYDIIRDENGKDRIIAQPRNSVLAESGGSCNFVASNGNIAFVADGLGGLKVLYLAINKAAQPVVEPPEEPELPVIPPVVLPAFLAAGFSATSLITTGAALKDGKVYVWGFRNSGQQGNGVRGVLSNAPLAKVNGLKNIVSLTGGAYHLLALADDGTVYGWGQNGYGEAGCPPNSGIYTHTPGVVMTNAVQISAGEYFSIALDGAGKVWTWGHNLYGQLGDGGKKNSQKPVNVDINGETARLIGGAYEGAFAVTVEGHVWAWGDNEASGLGFQGTNYGVQQIIRTPTKVDNLTPYAHQIVYIAGGNGWGQALLDDGRVIGWGLHAAIGQGTEKTNISSPEVVVVMKGVKQLFSRYVGSIALTEDGKVYTWGQTGGSAFKMIYGASPTQRQANGVVVEIGGGKEHVFYKTEDGRVYGVGYNDIRKLDISKAGGIIDWPGSLITF